MFLLIIKLISPHTVCQSTTSIAAAVYFGVYFKWFGFFYFITSLSISPSLLFVIRFILSFFFFYLHLFRIIFPFIHLKVFSMCMDNSKVYTAKVICLNQLTRAVRRCFIFFFKFISCISVMINCQRRSCFYGMLFRLKEKKKKRDKYT